MADVTTLSSIDIDKKTFQNLVETLTKKAKIETSNLSKPDSTFLGMDQKNVGLSLQGLGLLTDIYSEFGPNGNRALRKRQITALDDDVARAREEQQAIRDYRNSYK